MLGRLACLPSLAPCSLWVLGHNQGHHGFTQLRGRDGMWLPRAPDESLTLPRHRHGLERPCRSSRGPGRALPTGPAGPWAQPAQAMRSVLHAVPLRPMSPGRSPSADAALPPDCLNCGAALGMPRPRFCPDCGQETQLRPPTLGEFIQQFGGAYFSTEGALWRTLKLLLLRPGELTLQYLAGRRKHYVLPLRLYLTISLVVLLLMRLAASPALGGSDVVKIDTQDLRNGSLELGMGRAGMKDGKFFCENLPAWVCSRLQRRIDVDPKTLAREMAQVGERLVANLGAAMFVLLPSFALWLKLLYWNRRLHYTEHLVFALHLHSFWFLALAFAIFDNSPLTLVAVVAVPFYAMRAMKRVYCGRFWPRLLRAAVISGLYGLTLSLAVAVLGLWAVLT